jgi:hypothetical protein
MASRTKIFYAAEGTKSSSTGIRTPTYTVTLYLVDSETSQRLDKQTTTLTMSAFTASPTARIRTVNRDGTVALPATEIRLDKDVVVCVDFIPRAFNETAWVVLAISPTYGVMAYYTRPFFTPSPYDRCWDYTW